MEWIKFHFFHHERHAQAILSGDYGSSVLDSGAENEPQYWNTVIGLVLQGRLDGARALLKLHSASLSEPLKAVDYIMRTMPLYNVSLLLEHLLSDMIFSCVIFLLVQILLLLLYAFVVWYIGIAAVATIFSVVV
jgi:hypothetical protein